MAWTDEPTYNQIETLYRWFQGIVGISLSEAKSAVDWIETRANRKEMFDEMNRIKDLKDKGLLDTSNCFASKIWEGYPLRKFGPSKDQVFTIYRLLWPVISVRAGSEASEWMKRNSTGEEIGKEIARLENLKAKKQLTKENCFSSEIWKEYSGKDAIYDMEVKE